MNWPHHPCTILALSGLLALCAGWSGNNIMPLLLASIIIMPVIALFLFMPYVVVIAVIAALLSLTQAIRSAHHKSVPAVR